MPLWLAAALLVACAIGAWLCMRMHRAKSGKKWIIAFWALLLIGAAAVFLLLAGALLLTGIQ